MSEHQHRFSPTLVQRASGERVAGKRCTCGMETIGGVNANLVRAGEHFNRAMLDGVTHLAEHMRAAQRRSG